MKLSELVEHTAKWLNLSATTVGNYARFLREAREISGGIKGPGAIEMTDNDKLSLFIAVCACGTTRTSPQQLPIWRKLPYAGPNLAHAIVPPLKFLYQHNLSEALFTLFREIASGRLQEWREEYQEVAVTARFEIDREAATLSLERVKKNKFDRIEQRESYSAEYNNAQRVDLARVFGEEQLPVSLISPGAVYSKLVREVRTEGLAGWGQCLTN